MGGKIDHSINRGNAPYTSRLSGENYHCLGSLLPLDGRKPQFSQVYIYDTGKRDFNRQRVFGDNNLKVDEQEKHILNYLKTIQHDARQYNLPSSYEVAALIVGDIGDAVDNRDIIVTKKYGSLKRISELHPSYTPLQYPLFHPFGEDGYQVNILYKNVSSSSTASRKNVIMREFFACRIQDKPNTFSTMLNGRRLFQQILVDKYTVIEAQRLHFIRGKQHELRCDTYQSLREVKRFLKDTTLKSEDRPNILCRPFKLKLDAMIKFVKDKSLFGRVQAIVYTIEFQKRGLPYAHICIFLHPGSKIHNPKDVDKFISTKIPKKDSDPDISKLVSDHMIHGPCGDANPKCTCMVNKRYYKNFPNIFNDETAVDSQDISSCEAAWRIFAFDVHYRVPSVMRLAFHLPGEQHVIYGANKDIEDILNKTTNASSMFTGWFECNKNYDLAKSLTYSEFPTNLRRHQQMPFLDMETISRATNPLMVEELSYDTEIMNNEFNNLFDSLTDEQRGTLSASIRSKGEVVFNVASSGIASLLLEGGRTAHSRFLIPINLTEDSICPTSLIIWDEAPMIHKHAFEALDRTLNDVMNGDSANTSETLFGGKVVVFGGDFWQILPVVTNGTRSDCVNACINSSYIWSMCKIGQGSVSGPNDGESVINILDDLLILNLVDLIGDLIRFVYPNILDRFNELTYFQDRALLAPLNEVVQTINECMLALFPGEEVEYLSSDSLAECEDFSDVVDPQLYSPDLLNGLKMSGIPNHRLVLKVGVLIMLLRKINHKKGMCNGTHLQVVSLDRRLDMLKLSNHRKDIAHLELEREESLKVKWLGECANYESDYDGYPESLLSDDEVEDCV
ncbi:uncharacterized protein LOC143585354 [Bidens hawaiensis]|uniref:uncharacterized protein LOC143585354 n=1 Tax=Bidens hawaiensis TaxID=980011 RepID=UPI00404A3850